MIRQMAVTSPSKLAVTDPSRLLNKSLKNTVIYAKFDGSSKGVTQSINSQLIEAKSFIYAHNWRLDQTFVDADNYNYSSDGYRIKDRAVCKIQTNYNPRKFLVPELVPIHRTRRHQQRSAFNDMLLYIRNNPVDVILTIKLGHLAKNLKDLRNLIEIELEPRSIALQSITENFNSDSIEGKQFFNIIDSFSQFNSEKEC